MAAILEENVQRPAACPFFALTGPSYRMKLGFEWAGRQLALGEWITFSKRLATQISRADSGGWVPFLVEFDSNH